MSFNNRLLSYLLQKVIPCAFPLGKGTKGDALAPLSGVYPAYCGREEQGGEASDTLMLSFNDKNNICFY